MKYRVKTVSHLLSTTLPKLERLLLQLPFGGGEPKLTFAQNISGKAKQTEFVGEEYWHWGAFDEDK